jgi:hypothetical protein
MGIEIHHPRWRLVLKKILKNIGKRAVCGDIHDDGERISTNKRRSAMKTLTLTLLAVMVTGYAQEAKVVEPPKALVKAQKDYEKECARALQPINQNYLKVLESLKRDLGIRGDTAGMVAVQAAIDEVKEYLEGSSADETEKMAVGTWAISHGSYHDSHVVRDDGTYTNVSTGTIGTWKIKNGQWVLRWGKTQTWTANLPLKKEMSVKREDGTVWTFEKTSDKTK